MKFLAVLFLVGLALSHAVPIEETQELRLDEVEELDIVLGSVLEAEKRIIGDNVAKGLKKMFDRVMEKAIKDLEEGKEVSERTIEDITVYYERLKILGTDLKEDLIEIGENLSETAKGRYQEILKKVFINDHNIEKRSLAENVTNDLTYAVKRKIQRLQLAVQEDQHDRDMVARRFMHLMPMMNQPNMEVTLQLSELMDAVTSKQRKRSLAENVTNDLTYALKRKIQRLQLAVQDEQLDRNLMSQRLMSLMPMVTPHNMDVTELLTELMNAVTGKQRKRSITDNIKNGMREAFDRVLEKVKDALEKGKEISENTFERMKVSFEKLEEYGMDLRDKVKDLGGNLSEKAKEEFDKILERLGINNKRAIEFADEGGNELRKRFEDLVQKFKDAFENGKSLRDGLEKLKELRQKLIDLSINLGEKGKDMVQKLREKIKEYFQKFQDKLREKRFLLLKDLLRKLKEEIRESFDAEDVKAKIEEIIGKGTEVAEKLINKMKNKGSEWKENLLDFIDRLLHDEIEEKRSIKDIYEKVKDYFKNLQIELKEKFVKFGEWAKDKYEKGLQRGKDRAENLKKLAKEFIADAKVMGKDVAEQAKEFFREYKEDLGTVYDDLKDKINEILSRKEE